MLEKKAHATDSESSLVTARGAAPSAGRESGLADACADAGLEAAGVDHHCRICPTCGHQLTSRRCKLICANCGYYLSCADYY